MAKNISIRVAKDDDCDAILTFIREHYYKEEPITISHPEAGHTVDDEAFCMTHVVHDTVLVAIDGESAALVGVLIAGPIVPGDADEMLRNAEKSSKKWSDIQKLLAYIETKADVLGKFNLERALHCHVLTVHQAYRGNRIGQRLFEQCFANAQKLNYKLMSVDCTSIFTNQIAERCGMNCISTVTYDEYNEFIGEKLFQPREPNFEIKTFVREI
jgi:N-acetylglutamate synthase-like GNAT family acetyltransferase